MHTLTRSGITLNKVNATF